MTSFEDTGIGRNVGLPLPDEFNGKMEQWQDWSWQVKAYVSLFEVEALRVLVNTEVADASITNDALKSLKASDSDSDSVSGVQQTIAATTDTNHKWKRSTGCSKKC